MRKLALAVSAIVLCFNLAYAQDHSTERVVNSVFNPTKATVTAVRSGVVANDTGFPTIGSGVDYTGYSKARIYILATSTEPVSAPASWTVTPCYGDPTANGYFQGQSITVVSRDVYTLDVNGSTDVYFKITGANGAAGESCSIWSEPVK